MERLPNGYMLKWLKDNGLNLGEICLVKFNLPSMYRKPICIIKKLPFTLDNENLLLKEKGNNERIILYHLYEDGTLRPSV